MAGRVKRTHDPGGLLERAYDAAFEPQPFASLLPDLMAMLGADTGHINMWAPALGGSISSSHGIPDHLVRAYSDHYWRIDVWRHAFERRRIPVGTALAGHALVPFRELARSEMYNEGLRPYGLFDTCAGNLFARADAGAAVSLLRARGRPFYGRREIDRLGAVMPHMARAFALRLRFDEILRQRDAFAAQLDRLGDGVLLATHEGRLLHATEKARALLDGTNTPLRLVHGRLHARDGAADRRLHALLAAHAACETTPFRSSALALPADGNEAVYRLRLVPASVARRLVPALGGDILIVVERDGAGPRDAAARAAARYGLTPAETTLLREIVAGCALPAAAERLGRARTTVRNQLQSIFAKTGTHRQGALIAKILRHAG